MQEKQKKSKMSETKKAILIYSGELLLISLVFGVLGILMLAGVYKSSDLRRQIFVWVTLFGGFLTIGDFFWTLFNKKHRQKSSLLDKCLILPVGITFISYDLIVLITGANDNLHRYLVGSVFCYIFVIYVFEAVYHYFHPLAVLLETEEPAKPAAAPEAPTEPTSTKTDEAAAKPADEKKEN
jgi:hypothetical protein